MAARGGAAAGVRLGTAIARIGATVRETSLAKTTPALVQVATRVVEVRAEQSAKAMLAGMDTWLQTYASSSPLPPAVTGLLGTLGKQFGLAAHTAIATAIGFGVGTALGAVLEPHFAGMAQAAWEREPIQPLGLGELAEEVVRGFRTVDDSEREAARQGFDRNRLTRAVRLARARVPFGEVLELLNRREIDEQAARARLQLLGFGEQAAAELLTLRRRVPPATDVVRFTVREVYNPPLADALGYTAEFDQLDPQVFTDAEAAGVTREDLRKYWVAHWELPSPTQLYAMLHRGLIDTQQVRDALKAADYPEPWRDKLIGIANLVPGRVDLRRMYRAGVISKEEVLRGYLALGYEPKHAATLTEFAVVEGIEEERGLAKAEVTAAYEAGHVRREWADEQLRGLGYGPEEADLILGLVESRKERAFRDRALGTLRSRYVARKITESDAQLRMDALGIEARARDEFLFLWDLERDSTTADLTEAQMRAAWRAGIAAEDEYVGWLVERGYSEREVEILVELNRPRTPAPGP